MNVISLMNCNLLLQNLILAFLFLDRRGKKADINHIKRKNGDGGPQTVLPALLFGLLPF